MKSFFNFEAAFEAAFVGQNSILCNTLSNVRYLYSGLYIDLNQPFSLGFHEFMPDIFLVIRALTKVHF